MTEINTAGNTGLAKVAVQCSADTFVVNQSLVLRINPDSYRDGKNPPPSPSPKTLYAIWCKPIIEMKKYCKWK